MTEIVGHTTSQNMHVWYLAKESSSKVGLLAFNEVNFYQTMDLSTPSIYSLTNLRPMKFSIKLHTIKPEEGTLYSTDNNQLPLGLARDCTGNAANATVAVHFGAYH